MSDAAFAILVLLFIVDLVAAVPVTSAIKRRAYTGEKKALLLFLAWVVPCVGAAAAALIMWQRDDDASSG